MLLLSLPAIVRAQQVAIGEYPVPTSNYNPGAITAGPDGAMWFTEVNAFKIGRITTAGVITEYQVPGGSPHGITAGPDGALWFAEESGQIGRITTAGAITEYRVPNAPFVKGITTPYAPALVTASGAVPLLARNGSVLRTCTVDWPRYQRTDLNPDYSAAKKAGYG